MSGAAPADGALFVMPRGGREWANAAALWVTVAGWAEAARRRFGAAWVVTPDAVVAPDAVLDHTRPVPSIATARFPFVPTVVQTAAKDARRARRASAFRDAGERDEWRDALLAFVWQHHDLFHRAGAPVATRHRVPLVSYVHAPQVWEARRWGVHRPGWGRWVERYGEQPQLRESDVVACVSDEVADELVRLGVGRNQILVSPMAVDAERFTPSVSGAETRRALGLIDTFVVGWVGSFRGFHGLDSLVEAFGVLHARVPRTRLLLGGTGAELANVRDHAARLGIEDAVVLPGAIAHLDMPELVAAMDVAVVSARPGSGFHYSPLKLREYMASGVPTVAPRLGEVPRTVRDGEDALLYPAGDAEALAAQLLRVYDDEALRSSLATRGRELVIATATWDVRLEELLASPAFQRALDALSFGTPR
jgi:glycosyltransferase involved in cell wall biosynthesis